MTLLRGFDMSDFFIVLYIASVVCAGFFNSGKFFGFKEAGVQIRTDVVIYCNERPAECKKEYNFIKKKQEISNFQLPELERNK